VVVYSSAVDRPGPFTLELLHGPNHRFRRRYLAVVAVVAGEAEVRVVVGVAVVS
jgi:hypothetical protein